MTAHTRRSGFTLFELVLVLGVLLILAALIYPSLKGMFGYYKLQGGVDAVRTAWAHARAHAIEEGRPYRFAIEPGGSYFRVAPDSPEFWSGGASGSGSQGGFVLEQAMPAGVRFSVGAATAVPLDDLSTQNQPASGPSGQWVPAATFLPNGTAREDVRMTFQVRGARPMTLFLRGLTGSVSAQTAQP